MKSVRFMMIIFFNFEYKKNKNSENKKNTFNLKNASYRI